MSAQALVIAALIAIAATASTAEQEMFARAVPLLNAQPFLNAETEPQAAATSTVTVVVLQAMIFVNYTTQGMRIGKQTQVMIVTRKEHMCN